MMLLAEFFIWLYKKITWRQLCSVYWRYYTYSNRKDWYIDDCPFCEKTKNDAIEDFKYWLIVKNDFPYYNTKKHYLAIPKRHIKNIWELNNNEWIEIKNIMNKYTQKWYTLLLRVYGFNKHSSVQHIHFHLILEKNK